MSIVISVVSLFPEAQQRPREENQKEGLHGRNKPDDANKKSKKDFHRLIFLIVDIFVDIKSHKKQISTKIFHFLSTRLIIETIIFIKTYSNFILDHFLFLSRVFL